MVECGNRLGHHVNATGSCVELGVSAECELSINDGISATTGMNDCGGEHTHLTNSRATASVARSSPASLSEDAQSLSWATSAVTFGLLAGNSVCATTPSRPPNPMANPAMNVMVMLFCARDTRVITLCLLRL